MTYLEEAIALTRDARKAFGRIGAHKDPNLSDAGLAQLQAEMRRETRAAIGVNASKLRERAEARRFMSNLAATAARPRIGDDAGSLVRAQQKWEQTKLMLESGRPLHKIIETAELDVLLAIEEFAPTWLAAQTSLPSGFAGMGSDVTPHDLKALIMPRLIALSPKDAADALRDAQATEIDVAKAQPYIDDAERMSQGIDANPLGTAIASVYARF